MKLVASRGDASFNSGRAGLSMTLIYCSLSEQSMLMEDGWSPLIPWDRAGEIKKKKRSVKTRSLLPVVELLGAEKLLSTSSLFFEAE